MELVFVDAASIRDRDRWVGTAPDGVNALIDSEDVVDVVVQVLHDPSKRGGTNPHRTRGRTRGPQLA
jgi:hypothetical protein